MSMADFGFTDIAFGATGSYKNFIVVFLGT